MDRAIVVGREALRLIREAAIEHEAISRVSEDRSAPARSEAHRWIAVGHRDAAGILEAALNAYENGLAPVRIGQEKP